VLNLKFRRQHPLFGYIVDFYCHELKLALELDGRHHAKPLQRKKDEARDAFLKTRGITIIRIRNEDLTHDRLRGIIDPYCHARRSRPLRDSRLRLDSENEVGSE
jgi:very-short-patch-repair endonuclease